MTDLSQKIVKTMLMSLGEDFEKKYYDSEFKNCHGYLRINNYSALESLEEEEAEGLGMHTLKTFGTCHFHNKSNL